MKNKIIKNGMIFQKMTPWSIALVSYDGDRSIKEMVIPEEINHHLHVERIEAGVFAGMEALEIVRIPLGLASIGKRAFADCRKLRIITTDFFYRHSCQRESLLPASLTSIGEEAFFGTDIKKMVLLGTGVRIGNHCFAATPLQQITYYHRAIEFGRDALGGCFEEEIEEDWIILKKRGAYL